MFCCRENGARRSVATASVGHPDHRAGELAGIRRLTAPLAATGIKPRYKKPFLPVVLDVGEIVRDDLISLDEAAVSLR